MHTSDYICSAGFLFRIDVISSREEGWVLVLADHVADVLKGDKGKGKKEI